MGRNILHEQGMIFNFKNKTITCQEVSISIEAPNSMTKEFFVIKESYPLQKVTKRIKQILYEKHKKLSKKL